MLEEALQKLKYPNYLLDRKVKQLYNDVYTFTSKDECSYYNVSSHILHQLRVILGADSKDLDLLFKVPKSWFYFTNQKIMILYYIFLYYVYNNDKHMALYALTLLSMQTYMGLMVKYFPKCDNKFMAGAIASMRKSAIAKKYGSMGIAVFMSKIMLDKYFNILKSKGIKDEKIRILFLSELRHRMNQSMKSLATHYYAYYDKYGNEERIDKKMTSMVKIQSAISKVINDITMYNDVQYDVIKAAASVVKVSPKMAHNILLKLISDKAIIKSTLVELGKIIGNIEEFCEYNYKSVYNSIVKSRLISRKIYRSMNARISQLVEEWTGLSSSIKFRIIYAIMIYLLYKLQIKLCRSEA